MISSRRRTYESSYAAGSSPRSSACFRSHEPSTPFTGGVSGWSSMKEKRRRMAASMYATERSTVFMVPRM
ncbi:hypothetical protein [Streptomyces sp. BPTC-684]|uniref:hypothetical protein n=1 Tax=Streptomyces sp. BPTC-684 TaxID=3043734 RepID=UPI0024B182AC|nr:hypothetical protein [Streptomyces sp. BPTC-684]WHM39404.1 hypothetical protein QIY60_22670 [Streptomyces sp. BPTC-684]